MTRPREGLDRGAGSPYGPGSAKFPTSWPIVQWPLMAGGQFWMPITPHTSKTAL